ncbi:hypothetical protein PAPYR_10104 [Paratrimastix pyriformis]|uniref:Uncharacterized protein n=1 Tax=Paratrimastix pyriformis TaxID=342808 RepID=A0ABQ8UCC6_9EUKA|nr:hypothetical protein PAPYR_10104 [Paratrimastix pyriformis]
MMNAITGMGMGDCRPARKSNIPKLLPCFPFFGTPDASVYTATINRPHHRCAGRALVIEGGAEWWRDAAAGSRWPRLSATAELCDLEGRVMLEQRTFKFQAADRRD